MRSEAKAAATKIHLRNLVSTLLLPSVTTFNVNTLDKFKFNLCSKCLAPV